MSLPNCSHLTDLETKDHLGFSLSGPTTKTQEAFRPRKREMVSEGVSRWQGGGDGSEDGSYDISLNHGHPEGESKRRCPTS